MTSAGCSSVKFLSLIGLQTSASTINDMQTDDYGHIYVHLFDSNDKYLMVLGSHIWDLAALLSCNIARFDG